MLPHMLTVLHGFTETDESWAEILPPKISQARYELLPGHGGRPCPKNYTVPSVAAEIAERMPSGSDVLGYSMGGRIALQLALDHQAKVRRIIIVSSSAGLSQPDERQKRQKRDAHYAEVLMEDGIGPFVSWWESNPVLRPAQPYSLELTHHLRCRRLSQDPVGLANALQYLGAGVMPDLWPRLGELKIPVLLIVGEKDSRYLSLMKSMSEKIAKAKLCVIANSGHAVHREQTANTVQAIADFLAT
jgi:2-succinyl-6-hydroxy-2,4-cyclohexadiene-1-carboxylate synthase